MPRFGSCDLRVRSVLRTPAIANATSAAIGAACVSRPIIALWNTAPSAGSGSFHAARSSADWVHTTQASGEGRRSASTGSAHAVYHGSVYSAAIVYEAVAAPIA